MRSQGLRIAFFGASLASAWWNGASMYYRGILRALHARGHHITCYEPALAGHPLQHAMPTPPCARVVVYPTEDTSGLERCLEQARGADVVVKAAVVTAAAATEVVVVATAAAAVVTA